MVKLAVAIRDLVIFDDSASPGFDSRPMHKCPQMRDLILLLLSEPSNKKVHSGGTLWYSASLRVRC